MTERSARPCLRAPIPEIEACAQLLSAAVDAHLDGRRADAARLLNDANSPAVRAWCESIWGARSAYVQYRAVPGVPPYLKDVAARGARMPTPAERRQLIERDGYRCRFCGIPVIRGEVRERIRKAYPDVPIWGRRNVDQHAAFQAMWLQYDHLVPHARGGDNRPSNLVITCAPCNFGRMQYTLEEVGLTNPLDRAPLRTDWDGLERFV